MPGRAGTGWLRLVLVRSAGSTDALVSSVTVLVLAVAFGGPDASDLAGLATVLSAAAALLRLLRSE